MTATSLPIRAPRRKLLWALVAAVTIVGALFIGGYPARTFLAQRSELHRAQRQLDVLQAENAKLEQAAADLNTDSKIETLARERYNLVRPGEEAFAILPAPPPAIAVPPVWPFTKLASKLAPPPG